MTFDSLQGWLAWQESLHPLAIDLGLERAAKTYQAINPEGGNPPTITVGGTNGKGSCIAFLEAIYRAAGYRVGTYTSPHIIRYNERIRLNGEPASDDMICAAFTRIDQARNQTTLSYFEFGTLAALEIFRLHQVDIQLLEVGMGGRLDAVNIIDADAAIISSIAIDHIDWLGHTRETIAIEKAGIFRANTPAIIGDPNPPTTLLECAHAKQALAYCIGKDFDYQLHGRQWQWQSGGEIISQLPIPGLQGEHQYRNASAVIMAVMQLQHQLLVPEAAIRLGLRQVHLPGRFQRFESDSFSVILDVGHNPEAVSTLANHLNEQFPKRRIHAVFAMMKDKDIAGVVKIMASIVHFWYFVPLINPRAITSGAMQDIFAKCQITNASFSYTDFSSAFAAAKSQCQPGDVIIIFGSFFLVSHGLIELSGK